MLQIHTILHPTDFSDEAQPAMHIAHSLARDHHAMLVIVAVPPLSPPTHKYPFPPGQTEYASAVHQTQHRLEQLVSTISDIPVKHCVQCGTPGPAILAAAEEHQADLIVMGTHGRSGITRALLGSVAEHVLRHAACPVLTIKPGTGEHLNHHEETALAVAEPAGLVMPRTAEV